MNQTKIDNLLKIAKSYTFTSASKFIELADKENGWSDGFIADFNNKETAKAKTLLKHINAWQQDNKPEIKKIIPAGSRVADDIEYSLNNGCAVLKAKDINCYVNPSFLKYFYTAYDKFSSFKFVLTDELKPVKVVSENDLLGLIMPIRV